MESLNFKSNESRLEVILSYILIVGVVISLLLMITGIIILYLDTGNLNVSRDQSMFIHGKNFFSFVFEQLKEQKSQNPAISFIIIGTIVLMLTPFIRVVASLIYFAWVKDLKYVFITLIVLSILSISLSIH